MTNFEYLFIGAGLANLAAARNLFDRGERRIAVLDMGQKLDDRTCAGVKSQKCVFCERGCSILSGTGGTNALYGNKMCYFPASAQILEYFKKDALNEAWKWLDSTLSPWFRSENNRPHSMPNELGIKHYASEVFSPEQFGLMVSSLSSPLIRNGLIRQCAEVVNVHREKNGFVVSLKSGVKIRSKKVVLGVGRSGGDLTRSTCEALGVRVHDSQPDVGFRIEAPKELFSDFYQYQEDPKLKKTYKEGTVRTFCAENSGIIVPVPFHDGYFAEGAYPQEFKPENNVALMVRSDTPLTSEALREWCVRINKEFKNLNLGEVEVSGLSPSEMMNKVWKCFPHLPTATHDQLIGHLVALLSSSETPLFRTTNQISKVKIYGPAIDNYWPVPEVESELRTSASEFFVVGDSIGVSRGYVQALTSGAAWALTQNVARCSQTSKPQSKCHALV